MRTYRVIRVLVQTTVAICYIAVSIVVLHISCKKCELFSNGQKSNLKLNAQENYGDLIFERLIFPAYGKFALSWKHLKLFSTVAF